RKKAQGGKRVLYTTHNPTYDAKNRFDLPEELELDFKSIAHLFEALEQPVKEPELSLTVQRLNKMIVDAGISELELQEVVAEKGHYELSVLVQNYSDEFITRWIIPNWERVLETIKNKKGEQ
ncbi:MAG: hypothetical protein GXY87_07530, partial [Tissierellia bacterium]|nr:hypothetical protein [Tissierellia bacterium]